MTESIKSILNVFRRELTGLTATKLKKTIFESVRGHNYNLTEINLLKAFALLAVPMVIEMTGESLFAVSDIFFVSKLGADAVSTVGLTESVMTIIYSVAFGLCVAATALTARRYGEGNKEAANHTAFQAVLVGIITSAIITLPAIIYSDDILRAMGLAEEVIARHGIYTQYMLGANIIVFLLFIINSVFRAAGDAAVTLRVLLFSNLLNIVLCPVLIFGLGPIEAQGIKGAALATIISRSAGILLQLKYLFGGKKRISFGMRRLKADFRIIGEMFKLSVGAVGQNLIAMTSWILLMRFIADFGTAITAGYTIALRILFFILLPTSGISNSAAALVGQNLGAGNPGRAVDSVKAGCIINFVLLGTATIILTALSEILVSLFIDSSDALRHGAYSLRIMSIGLIFYGWGMIFLHSINGAGDTKTPTIFNIVIFWLIELPLAYFLAFTAGMGDGGIYWSIVISETILTLTAARVFAKGKWKTVNI